MRDPVCLDKLSHEDLQHIHKPKDVVQLGPSQGLHKENREV